jgi:hypothetical protein
MAFLLFTNSILLGLIFQVLLFKKLSDDSILITTTSIFNTLIICNVIFYNAFTRR